MTGKRRIFYANVAVAMLCLSGPVIATDAPPRAFADEVLGRWDLTVEGEDGPYPSWLFVQLRTERELMADFVGRFGSKRHATGVTYIDDRLEVRIPVQPEADDNDLVLSCTLENGMLTGRVSMGDGSVQAWRGTRAPLLDRPAIEHWAEPVRLIGSDLDGWRLRDEDLAGCWSVNEGILSATPPCTDLISQATFDDFRLQLEFRYPPGSNSGVYLRGRYEVQVQDDFGKALDPLRMGGIYGFIAPKVDAARPAGKWQRYDVMLVGRRVTVTLNDTEIISNHEIPGITGGALDSDEASAGPLMLQGDHGPIEYRNIVITPGN